MKRNQFLSIAAKSLANIKGCTAQVLLIVMLACNIPIASFAQLTELSKVIALDPATSDFFGQSVSFSGNYAIVGAYGEDHDTTGGGCKYVLCRLSLHLLV